MSECDLAIAFRFPFGRYAATPWYRSRREHVDNVEWPPSPWRIARALVAVADQFTDRDTLDATLSLVRRLAASEPEYALPPASQLHYSQWMPRLDYSEHVLSSERTDNGHSMLDLDPVAELVARWPGVALDPEAERMLDELLARLPFLGQSFSVCEAQQQRSSNGVDFKARPAETASETTTILLCPTPSVSNEEIMATTDGGEAVKAQAAPPGARWVPYAGAMIATARTPRKRSPRVVAATYTLRGVARPPAPRPGEPRDETIRIDDVAEAVRAAVAKATGVAMEAIERVDLIDDDLDGSAERVRVEFREDVRVSSGLFQPKPFKGWIADARIGFECEAVLDAVEWNDLRAKDNALSQQDDDQPVDEPLCFAVKGDRRPLLADAIVVAEVFHRRLLGVARRRWGTSSIPARISGRAPGGRRLESQHSHAHVLLGGGSDPEVTHLVVWARGGFTPAEQTAIRQVTLPALAGSALVLKPAKGHPILERSTAWRTLLPFLPTRHPKMRGGRLRESIEDQVRRELSHREMPPPVDVRLTDQDWGMVRTVRRSRDRSKPQLGAHGVEVEFDRPVRGPIALGANCHYSMGLFVPLEGD